MILLGFLVKSNAFCTSNNDCKSQNRDSVSFLILGMERQVHCIVQNVDEFSESFKAKYAFYRNMSMSGMKVFELSLIDCKYHKQCRS